MKLQAKTTLIIASSFIVAGLMVVGLFTRVLLSEFERLEDLQVADNMSRVEEAFKQEVAGLLARGKDWAMWDDAFNFVSNPNPEFVEANLTYSILEPLEFDHVVFVNRELRLIHAVQIDRKTETLLHLPFETVEPLISSQIARGATEPNARPLGGFISIGGRNFIVAITQVRNSTGQSEPVGLFVITKEVSDEFVDRMAKVTRVPLLLEPPLNHQHLSRGSSGLDSVDAFLREPAAKNESSIKASSEVYNILGAPLFSLQASFDRSLYYSGLATRRFFAEMLALICLSLCSIVLILVRIMVTGPIRRMVAELATISDESHFSRRISIRSNDEVGILSTQINNTLNSLEHSLKVAEHAQHAAETANRAKSSFIAKVSHELRTPIHSITGMLRILLKEERSGAKRNYIMMARNSAYGLLETINEILDFSKAEAGKLVLEKIEFSLHDVIRESMQTVGPRIEEKGSLETIVQVPQGIPNLLFGDPLRLRQVLVNLLGNAAKFTKQGHIGLQVAIRDSAESRVVIELIVFDTGVGIPADRLEHIFEPFGQADESVARMFTGTGLGLTIVKQFIDGMDGSVRVESELGVGSRFILTIPFDIPPAATPVVFKPTLISPRIALIDGDSLIVERFSQELEESGYVPEIFRSDEARELTLLSSSLSQYGLILVTSEAMKRSWVFDLVVELRGRESTPVVSILSPFEISVRERLLALEVPFVVTRPISLLDILGVVSGQISLNSEGWEDREDWSLQSGRPLEVLVADDAQTNRIILTELLRDAGHHVVCVENGVDLVARVRDSLQGVPGVHKFDIVLTDVQMPMLDGLSATSQIRELEKALGQSSRLPIIAVTAHAMTDETSRMRTFGVDDVVTKPLDPVRLGQIMQRLTGQQVVEHPRDGEPVKTSSTINDTQLVEIALRLWTNLAKRDDSISELFGLSEDPLTPEDFQRVLDVVDVIDRSGNSVRRTLLIFSGFLECFREQVKKLNEAKQSKSVEDLRFTSHALKGLLLDVGARASGMLASAIEQQCKDGNGQDALASVGRLTKQALLVARLISQIRDAAGNKREQRHEDFVQESALSDENTEQE